MAKSIKKLSLKYLIGIDVPDFIKEEIHLFLNNNFNEYRHLVNFIDFQEYHITISYIGKITEHQRSRLIAVTDQIKIPPFTIGIKGLSLFPPTNNPKNLKLNIDKGKDQLKAISEKIRNEVLQKAGLISKNQFSPYITIGNINKLNHKKTDLFKYIETIWDYPFGHFQVNSFHLYRINNNKYQHNHEVKFKNNSKLIIEE